MLLFIAFWQTTHKMPRVPVAFREFDHFGVLRKCSLFGLEPPKKNKLKKKHCLVFSDYLKSGDYPKRVATIWKKKVNGQNHKVRKTLKAFFIFYKNNFKIYNIRKALMQLFYPIRI